MNETMLPKVREGLLKSRNEADKYAQLLDEYKGTYVDPSELHAKKLENEAADLKKYFWFSCCINDFWHADCAFRPFDQKNFSI